MHERAQLSIDGQHLTVAELSSLVAEPLHVTVADDAMHRVRKSHEWSVRLAAERPLYGRVTGVGANRDVVIEPSVAAAQALLASHATSAGRPRSTERVRALLLVRLNQLCAGGSGVAPRVVEELARLINDDALPIGDIEATGYHAVWHGQKGFNGVAILARDKQPTLRQVGLPGDPDDAEDDDPAEASNAQGFNSGANEAAVHVTVASLFRRAAR